MQDMLKNMMGDMWKNVGNMDTMNWAKDMNMPNDLNPTKIGLQVLGFQKKTMEAVIQMQQKAEEMTEPLLKNSAIPEAWTAMYTNSKDSMKKSIDDGFAKMEVYLAEAAGNSQQKAEKKTKTATEEK